MTPDVRPGLFAYLAGTLREIDCPALQVGGVEDHVHVLFGLSRTKAIAFVVENVKTGSSKWLKIQSPQLAGFAWQSGYGAFSVAQSNAEQVIQYIQKQDKHHEKVTFQDEYRAFLEKYQVPYDERYVWD